MVKEGFVLLYDIGVVSQEILSFKRQAKELPKEIKQLSTDIDSTQNSIEKNRALVEKFEDEVHEASLTREDIRSSLKKAEEKIPNISNNEEYDFVYKEISNFKGKIKSLTNKINVLGEDKQKLEDEINELLEVQEEKSQEFAPEIKAKKKELNSLESKMNAKKDIIADLLKKLEEVSPKIAKVYNRLASLSSTGTVTIGFVDPNQKSAHCSHCFSILPLQQKTKIRDSADICICENCSSILVSNAHATNLETAE